MTLVSYRLCNVDVAKTVLIISVPISDRNLVLGKFFLSPNLFKINLSVSDTFKERVRSTPFHFEGTLRASFNFSKHYNIKFSFFNQVRIACPNTILAI